MGKRYELKGGWGGARVGAGRPKGSTDARLDISPERRVVPLSITLTKDEWAVLTTLAPDGKPLKEAVRCIRAYLSTLTANSSATTFTPDTEAIAS